MAWHVLHNNTIEVASYAALRYGYAATPHGRRVLLVERGQMTRYDVVSCIRSAATC